MLKINPIITVSNYDTKGLQLRKSDVLASAPVMKPTLKTDIFEKQKRVEIPSKSFAESILNISFEGLKKQNRYEQGREIATNMKDLMKGRIGAIESEEFKKEYKKIDEKNVIPTINAYNKISPDETLISAICKERASSTKSRKQAVNGITEKLINWGNKAGVQTEHYKEHFDKELNNQFDSLLPVKTPQLDKISGALVQAIQNKEGLTDEERKDLKNAKMQDTQSYTTSILNSTVKKAEKSMNDQAEYDGWSAKLGEQIRKLWNSENQKELVHDDIKTFDNQVKELDKLVGTKEYNKKFKEIFDVEYDPELIAVYKQKEEKYSAASICSAVENNFEKSVKDLLINTPFEDRYDITYTMTGGVPVLKETKEQMYERNLNAFAEFVGKGDVEEGKKQITKTMRDYKVKPDSPMKDKFGALKRMANKYDRVLQRNTKNATGKKDLQEMKREYENSYYAAFGVKNDIAKRVSNYRNSQMWSEILVQDTLLSAASIPIWMCTAGTGIIPTLQIAAMHSAADMLVYGSDRLSSKQGMKEKDIVDIIKTSTYDGVTAIANQLAYKGIEALTSPVAKMSGKAAKLTDFALSTAADVAIDTGVEYLATGKVTLQGVVYSVTFSVGGYLVDFRVDDVQRKTL